MRRRRRTGFTLLEIVLALGIFAILSVVVIDVFFSTGREERRGVARSQGTSSSRFALELMAREARVGRPDYEFYAAQNIALVDGGGNPRPVSTLALVLPDNTHRIYRCAQRSDTTAYSGDSTCPIASGQLQASETGGILTWETVTIEDAEVLEFQVVIAPELDPFPFTAKGTVDEQPTVTISLTTRGVGDVEQTVTSHFQTTVTSRTYAR